MTSNNEIAYGMQKQIKHFYTVWLTIKNILLQNIYKDDGFYRSLVKS